MSEGRAKAGWIARVLGASGDELRGELERVSADAEELRLQLERATTEAETAAEALKAQSEHVRVLEEQLATSEQAQRDLETRAETLENEQRDNGEELERRRDEVTALRDEMTAVRDELRLARESLVEGQAKARELQELRLTRVQEQKTLMDLRAEHAEAQIELRREMTAHEGTRKALSAAHDELESSRAAHAKELSQTRERCEELAQQLASTRSSLQTETEKSTAQASHIAELEAQARTLADELSDLRADRKKLAEVQRELAQQRHAAEAGEQDRKRLEGEVQQSLDEQDALSARLDAIQAELTAAGEAQLISHQRWADLVGRFWHGLTQVLGERAALPLGRNRPEASGRDLPAADVLSSELSAALRGLSLARNASIEIGPDDRWVVTVRDPQVGGVDGRGPGWLGGAVLHLLEDLVDWELRLHALSEADDELRIELHGMPQSAHAPARHAVA